ncbi:PREDICTED: endoplasmic reticulum metallopeptidase 1-like [Nicrophorus vespilloides]|uniref:Endoplasmic reticulum metallopeptidase 1-like n=1 Tax=Nicrophorus vespilloides TaxID=110193 RepID=A0ABM1N4G9_NICVS|nr:PREDICTED: endoplasmic reticulum metallopeptidase 1-like [Nicrophorus vespilloides]
MRPAWMKRLCSRLKNKQKNYFNSDSEYSEFEHSLPIWFSIIFLIIYAGIFTFVYYYDQVLPKADTDEYVFKSFNAGVHLKHLVDLGPRVVGSDANEIKAVKYLNDQIEKIVNGKNPLQKIEHKVEVVSGSYFLDYKPYGAINVYSNVKNVVARIKSKHENSPSVLINAHFDSVPESPGGSDDGIMCSVMLEILRIMSNFDERPENNIVFLFNGAEETALQASHGFITNDEWAKDIRVVINLEATGAEGREMLFQTGPKQPWLLKYYSQVPHPHAQVAGEELFQSNIIPSDTDFRIFRDYGDCIGFDFAYTRNGYRYHTKYDDNNINIGVIQHTGNNILELLKQLSNAPEVGAELDENSSYTVYYDFLGVLFIRYDRTVELIFNILCIVISLLSFAISVFSFKIHKSLANFKYVGIALGVLLLSYVIAVAFVIVIGVIIDSVDYTMRWYNNTWLILGLYCGPVVGIIITGLVLFARFNKNNTLTLSRKTQMTLQLNNLLWTIILLVGTCIGIRSVYVIVYHVLFSSIGFLIIQVFRLQFQNHLWKLIYFIAMIIPTIFVLQISLEIIYLFLPICGRNGGGSNPEIMVSAICFFLTLLATSYFLPLFMGVRKGYLIAIAFFVCFVVFFILVFTTVTFPYSAENRRPQRYPFYHTSRTIRNDDDIIIEDSGYTFAKNDRNSPLMIQEYVSEIEDSLREIGQDCESALFCGLPTTNSRSLKDLSKNFWMEAPPIVKILPKTTLKLETKKQISSTIIEYTFLVEGPSRLNIYFAPKEDVKLLKIGFLKEVPNNEMTWNGRPAYYISYASGGPTFFQFSLVFETPKDWDKNVLDIAVAGKYIHDVQMSNDYVKFLSKFPVWTFVNPWVATYESWAY